MAFWYLLAVSEYGSLLKRFCILEQLLQVSRSYGGRTCVNKESRAFNEEWILELIWLLQLYLKNCS